MGKIDRKRAVKLAMGVFGNGQRRDIERLLDSFRQNRWQNGEPFSWREVLKQFAKENCLLAAAVAGLELVEEDEDRMMEISNRSRRLWLVLEGVRL